MPALDRVRRLVGGHWKYVTASEDGGGGSQTVKHEVIPIDYTDIDAATGLIDLYLLPENETVVSSWPVVTETFNGTDSNASPFEGVGAWGPTGSAGGAQMSDSFDLDQSTSIDNAIDGLMGPDPADGGGNNTTTTMFPLVSPEPGGGSLQTVIDVANGNTPLTSIGTQGHLDYHLVIAVAP